jgi:hypothetical protein
MSGLIAPSWMNLHKGKTMSELATLAREAYANEIHLARLAERCGQYEVALDQLARAHVLQQTSTLRHAWVHWLMLRVGMHGRDWREAIGQLPRLVSALIFSRVWVPRGNSGRARVSAFAPMAVPTDLRHLIP